MPNRAGRALTAFKEPQKIGVLLPSVGNVFFDGIIDGINDAISEYEGLGIAVVIKNLKGFDVDSHLKAVDELVSLGCKALCLTTVNTQSMREKINECSQKGIHVILLNQEVESVERLCYVGSDYFKAGVTSAGLLSLITHDIELNILIVTGSKLMRGHNQRIYGFIDELRRLNKKFKIVSEVECNDSDIIAQQLTSQALQDFKEINCVYVTGAGVQGVGASLIAHGDKNIIAIAFDDIYTTKELVKAGIIKFVVCQQPKSQGYNAIKRAYQAISGVVDKTSGTDYFTDVLIKISSNID